MKRQGDNKGIEPNGKKMKEKYEKGRKLKKNKNDAEKIRDRVGKEGTEGKQRHKKKN